MLARILIVLSLVALNSCQSSKSAINIDTRSVEGAIRAAEEAGARRNKLAERHLELARTQLGEALSAVGNGDERAQLLAERALVDAELARVLALAEQKERDARLELESLEWRVKLKMNTSDGSRLEAESKTRDSKDGKRP